MSREAERDAMAAGRTFDYDSDDEDEDASLNNRSPTWRDYAHRVTAALQHTRTEMYRFAGGMSTAAGYVWADSKRNPVNVFVGIFTLVLVLTFVCLLDNGVEHSPIIFVKLAENQVGEYDLLLTPRLAGVALNNQQQQEEPLEDTGPDLGDEEEDAGERRRSVDTVSAAMQTHADGDVGADASDPTVADVPFAINRTEVHELIHSVKNVGGVVPRWTLLGRVSNARDLSKNASSIILIIDSKLEDKYGIGRDWNYRPLGLQEAHITTSVLHGIGVQGNAGERVYISIDPLGFAAAAADITKDDFRATIRTAVHRSFNGSGSPLMGTDSAINDDTRVALLEALGIEIPDSALPPSNRPNANPPPLPESVQNLIADQLTEQLWPAFHEQQEHGFGIEFTVVDEIEDPYGKVRIPHPVLFDCPLLRGTVPLICDFDTPLLTGPVLWQWPSSLGNVVVLDAEHILPMIKRMVPTNPIVRGIVAAFVENALASDELVQLFEELSGASTGAFDFNELRDEVQDAADERAGGRRSVADVDVAEKGNVKAAGTADGKRTSRRSIREETAGQTVRRKRRVVREALDKQVESFVQKALERLGEAKGSAKTRDLVRGVVVGNDTMSDNGEGGDKESDALGDGEGYDDGGQSDETEGDGGGEGGEGDEEGGGEGDGGEGGGVPDEPVGDVFDLLDAVDIHEYAMMVVVKYSDRLATYVKQTKPMKADLIKWTNDVFEALGVDYPVQPSLPLEQVLVGLNILRLFLDQVFNSVLIVLVMLGVVLIYSLLLSDVEDKTYEYGMLRALGLPHNSLIQLLLIQGIFYAIPGILISLALAWVLSLPVSWGISYYASTPIDLTFYDSAIILAVVMGISMPLISNIFPIQRALSRTLRDSLDVYHQSSAEVSVQMVRLENLGLSSWQLSASLMMICSGFVIYYLVPYAFIFANLSLFLTILNTILLGMLFGMSLLATILQPILERWVLYWMLWGEETKLYGLVRKSLSGHRGRNRKTAIMFSTSLAFIIFAGAMFTLQSRSIVDNVKAGVGADIVVIAARYDSPLDQENIRQYLEQELQNKDDPVLLSYSFVSFPMWLAHDVHGVYISNLAEYPWRRISVFGVEEDFLNTIYSDYYILSKKDERITYDTLRDSDSKYDVVKSLYTHAGESVLPIEADGIQVPPNVTTSHMASSSTEHYYYRSNNDTYHDYLDIIVSEAMRNTLYIDPDTPTQALIEARYDWRRRTYMVYLTKIRAMMSKVPGFFFSSYPETSFISPMLVSMDTYQKVMSQVYDIREFGLLREGTSPEEIEEIVESFPRSPQAQRLLVRVIDDATLTQRERIMNGIRNHISDDITVVIDTPALLDTTKVAVDILILFFNLVSIIASVLCFFVLWLSFTANIRENSWEFGVLRAIGLSASQVTRVYIYEAISIIVSALVLGSGTGVTVAITLTLQFNLFTEMPFHFDFPIGLFVSVVIMSMITAVGGSFFAARDVRKQAIAQTLKGNI